MRDCFRLSSLIRGTLICVYLALVVPLPLMAPPSLQLALWIAAPLGLFIVLALLSEEVCIDEAGLVVGHPQWCRWLLRRGWQLRWEQIHRVVPVGTSQGGFVYYLKTSGDGQHRLLPQRLERFDQFLIVLQDRTGIDTSGIGRLTPPWTYQLLASIAVVMLTTELVVATAIRMNWMTLPAGYPG